MKTRVERINPYLEDSDISESIRYYLDVLGFDLYVETPVLAIIQRDGHQIHLRPSNTNINPQRVWIGVEDIAVLFRQLKENGVIFNQLPTNFSWAYQMMIEDLDGNLLIFGSGPLEDQPFQD